MIQSSTNIADVMRQTVSSFTAANNIATHKANSDERFNSYGLWNNKASIASSSTESASLFGAASSEADHGIKETGYIQSEINILENSAFFLQALVTQGDQPMMTGMNEVIARQNAASGNNPYADKLAKEASKRYQDLGEVQELANIKVNDALEMKSNLGVMLDQVLLLFNGLRNAADNNLILSMQTADTRKSNVSDDVKIPSMDNFSNKPKEVKNDADKKSEKEAKNGQKEDKSNKYQTSESNSNSNKTLGADNNSKSSLNNASPFAMNYSTPNMVSITPFAPAAKPFIAVA